MQMDASWLQPLEDWAAAHQAVWELWLFGSRAQNRARPDSDALVLMPPIGKTDWALGDYAALGDRWQGELEAIVGRHVSLTILTPEISGEKVCLWRRSS
jgi:predicted nucleotidyltransferase